jgi:hypothetical protein
MTTRLELEPLSAVFSYKSIQRVFGPNIDRNQRNRVTAVDTEHVPVESVSSTRCALRRRLIRIV